MGDLKTSVVVDLTGNLQRRAQRYGQSLARFSQIGQRNLRRLSGVANMTGKTLDRMGNKYVALASGAAGVGSAKYVIDLERRFTRLGIQSNRSVEDMTKLKKLIYETAQAPNIRVDPSQITSAIEAIVEKTGDLQFAQDNIKNIGMAIQATGAEGGAVGELLAEFQKMGIKAPKEVLKAIDVLNVQGKEGAFTLENLAALGPRVITAYTAMGRTGVPALREMGAALQVIRMGTGDADMAATAFEATLRNIGDPVKLKMLQNAGIQVFDPKKLKEGVRVLRPINQLMIDIVKAAGGDKTKLATIFDADAIRAFNQAASEYQRTGKLDMLQKFMNVQADGSTTMKDSARAAHDAAGSLQNLYTAWKKFADNSLTGPIQSLADLLNSLGSETTGKIIKYLVVGGAGALVAGKAWKFGSAILGHGKGKGALGGALGGMPLPLPVYVVNRHMSLTPDSWGGGPMSAEKGVAGRLARSGGKWSRMLGKVGKRAGLPLALLSTGLDLYSTWSNSNLSTKQKLVQTGGAAGGAAGAWGGAELGAAIGTAILPGIGTLVGSLLGGGIGYFTGESIAEKIGSSVAKHMDKNTKEAKVKIEVESKDGSKATVKHARSQGMQVDVDSGLRVGGAR